MPVDRAMNPDNAPKEDCHLLGIVRIVAIRLPLVILVAMLCLVVGGSVAWMLPREYRAAALVEVANGGQMEIFGEAVGGVAGDPRFASTQLHVITSRETLERAAVRAGLADRGTRGSAEVMRRLERSVSARMLRNTPLLQVVARGATPGEAASIANAVVEAYEEARKDMENRRREAEMGALAAEVEKQRGTVGEAEALVRKLADEAGIADLNPGSDPDAMEAWDSNARELETEGMAARARLSKSRALADRAAQIEDRQLVDGHRALGLNDDAAAILSVAVRETEAEISRMRGTGIGDGHPKTKALRAKLASYLGRVAEHAGALRRSLESIAMADQGTVNEIEDKISQEKKRHERRKGERQEYDRAKAAHHQAEKVLRDAQDRLVAGTMQASMPMDTLRIWELAEPGTAVPAVNVPMVALVCCGAGLVLGGALALFMDYLDTSARTVKDVEGVLDAAMLCVVPSGTRSLAGPGWGADDAEPYQMLRIGVEGAEGFRRGFSVAVTSGAAGEGKSTTAANLACAFASGGYRALLVDCDLRRPTQHRIFGLKNGRGVSDSGDGLGVPVVQTRVRGVSLATAGGPASDPEAVLSSSAMVDFLREARGAYDIVILDSPPILGLGDAGILSRTADCTLVVVRHRQFPSSMLARARACLAEAGARVLGAVLNDTDIRHDENFDRYTGYYGYHSGGRGEASAY